jgi:hypothetical protein
MDAVVLAVDYIRRNDITYHQFQHFLERSYSRIWRCFLFASKTFEQRLKFCVLKIGIYILVTEEGKTVPQLSDNKWVMTPSFIMNKNDLFL